MIMSLVGRQWQQKPAVGGTFQTMDDCWYIVGNKRRARSFKDKNEEGSVVVFKIKRASVMEKLQPSVGGVCVRQAFFPHTWNPKFPLFRPNQQACQQSQLLENWSEAFPYTPTFSTMKAGILELSFCSSMRFPTSFFCFSFDLCLLFNDWGCLRSINIVLGMAVHSYILK